MKIHEDLTRKNQTLLSKTSKKQGVVSAWSKDGRIFATVPQYHSRANSKNANIWY